MGWLVVPKACGCKEVFGDAPEYYISGSSLDTTQTDQDGKIIGPVSNEPNMTPGEPGLYLCKKHYEEREKEKK